MTRHILLLTLILLLSSKIGYSQEKRKLPHESRTKLIETICCLWKRIDGVVYFADSIDGRKFLYEIDLGSNIDFNSNQLREALAGDSKTLSKISTNVRELNTDSISTFNNPTYWWYNNYVSKYGVIENYETWQFAEIIVYKLTMGNFLISVSDISGEYFVSEGECNE